MVSKQNRTSWCLISHKTISWDNSTFENIFTRVEKSGWGSLSFECSTEKRNLTPSSRVFPKPCNVEWIEITTTWGWRMKWEFNFGMDPGTWPSSENCDPRHTMDTCHRLNMTVDCLLYQASLHKPRLGNISFGSKLPKWRPSSAPCSSKIQSSFW